MAYDDALNAKINNVYLSAGDAASDLAQVVAGADVLASQFVDVKTTMQNLQAVMDELKSNYWYVPVGVIAPFGGSYSNRPPNGWLFCDGSVVSQATYDNLFDVISSLYNTGGEGAGNFRLPDFRSRVPLGATDQASGSAPTLGNDENNSQLPTRSLGARVGAVSIPSHNHGSSTSSSVNLAHSHSGSGNTSHNTTGTYINSRSTFSAAAPYTAAFTGANQGPNGSVIQDPGHSHSVSIGTDSQLGSHTHTVSTNSAGTGSHGVVQPSLVVSFIIKF